MIAADYRLAFGSYRSGVIITAGITTFNAEIIAFGETQRGKS